jgi:hypothetical protein
VPVPTRPRWLRASVVLFLLTPALALGAGGSGAFASALLALAVILAGAKVGGDLMSRLGQPAVLGELLVGVFLGNLDLVGISFGEAIGADPFVQLLGCASADEECCAY